MCWTSIPILVFWLFFDLLVAASVSATAVLMVRTEREIIVAADSKIISERYPDWTPATGTICKIHKLNDTFFFSTAGFRSDFTGTFNVVTAIRNSYYESRSIAETVAAAEAFIKSSLLQTLDKLKRETPESFEKNFVRNSVVDFAAFGLEGDSMVVYIRRLRATRRDDGSGFDVIVHRENCPGDCKTSNEILYLGEFHAMREYVQQLNSNPPVRFPALPQLAKNAVNAAIAHSETVGPPIDILRINRQGSSWVEVKKECR